MVFRVNQKVVCVNDEYNDPFYAFIPNRPVLRGIYTIRGICTAHGHLHVYLQEIHNRPDHWTEIGFAEPPFWAGRFRPVVERKTDISQLEALLNPANHRELV